MSRIPHKEWGPVVASGKVLTKKFHFYQGPTNQPEGFARDARLLTGTVNPELADAVSRFLGVAFHRAEVKAFGDGEIGIQLIDSVRGKDVFIVQPVCRDGVRGKSVNDSLVETLLLLSAARRCSAERITLIMPYYAYARQDRKMKARVPISAADVAVLFTSMGVDRVLCIDLHCGQIQGFFPPSVPLTNIGAGPIGALYFGEKKLVNPTVISPDAGGVGRANDFRHVLHLNGYPNAGVAMIVKQRRAASEIARMDLVGEVMGHDCIIVDDMVDTAGTLCAAASLLKKAGAVRVFAFCTHGVLSDPAGERIAKSQLDELVVTDTIPLPKKLKEIKQLKVLSIAPILAEAIHRLHKDYPMSDIFEQRCERPPNAKKEDPKAKL